MAKRFTLSPVLGSGTGSDSFRSAMDDVPQTNARSLIPGFPMGDPQAGHPKYHFAFSVIGTANLSGTLAVSNAFVFPDYPLDGRLDGMEAATRDAMVQNAEAYDLNGAGLHLTLTALNDDANSYRQFLQGLGAQFEPTFNINTFDVTEPAQ